MTDGYDTRAMNQSQYRDVDWLLTTNDDLSIQSPLGRIDTMEEDNR